MTKVENFLQPLPIGASSDKVVMWHLPPVVGEINQGKAVILCEPVEKIENLIVCISPTAEDQQNRSRTRAPKNSRFRRFSRQKSYSKTTPRQNIDPPIVKIELDASVDTDVELTDLSLFLIDNNKMWSVEVIPTPTGPTRFVLSFPEAGSYDISWYQKAVEIYSHRLMISNKLDKAIFVSCDMFEANSRNSTWKIMEKEINSKESIKLFHLGDQAYMDGVFKHCLKYAEINGQNEDTTQYILNKFGERYCQTWSPHHNILSHVSNYNMWDDHEIKNNLNLSAENLTENQKYVVEIATQSYYFYQESQHLQFENILTDYSWYKIMGEKRNILVVAIERQSGYNSTKDIISSIHEIIRPPISGSRISDSIDTLILCLGGPPVPAPKGRYGSLYRLLTRDYIDNPDSKFYSTEDISNLYKGLFDFMIDYDIKDILLIGGDLHMGLIGQATYKQYTINVAIASPITNQPTLDRKLASKGLKGTHHITEEITFHTVSTRAHRCYVVVNFPDDNTGMQVNIEYNKDILPRSSLNYIRTLLKFK